MSEVGSGGSACGIEQDLSPGGILWKAGAPKKTSLVKEKGSMYVCYECFYECICDVHMCTQAALNAEQVSGCNFKAWPSIKTGSNA